MLFSSEGALHVSIDANDAPRSEHFKLQISIVRDRIEAGESGSSEQCVIATTKRDNIKDQFFTTEVVREPNTTSSVNEPVQWASMSGITPLKVVLLGLILDGSMPILRTVSW